MAQSSCNDLLKRMENVENPAKERRKRIQKEFNSSKKSRDYYKGRALERLNTIIKENPVHSEFVSYIDANSQIFSDDEYKEIEDILNKLKSSEEEFEKWKKNH